MAIFFGLSGTGKTTLSADPARHLIGDDEHGWGDTRRLQLRGRLLREGDPPLGRGRAGDLRDDARGSGRCSRTSSSTSTGSLDLDERRRRPRTRAAPTSSRRSRTRCRRSAAGIRRTSSSSPPTRSASCRRSRGCTSAQAMYHFLSGFTAKLAGTEIGVTEPSPTFSPCFGGPVPAAAAGGLRAAPAARSSREHGPSVWLVNTGWTGGPAGDGGHRMPIARDAGAASRGALRRARRRRDAHRPRLRLRGAGRRCRASTASCSTRARPGPTPRRTTRKARELAAMFRENFEQFDGRRPRGRRRRAGSERAKRPAFR